jgi:hypothetical protein
MPHTFEEENARSAEELRLLADGLSESDFARSVGGGWTVGTVFGHLAFWDRRVAAFCELWHRGLPTYPSPADDHADEAVNEALQPLLNLVPGAQSARLAVEAAVAANNALASLTPAQAERALAPDSPIVAERNRHRREHIEQIKSVLN